MNYQLTARIQRKMPEFSKGQRLIANYIEEHYDEVAFMTAAKLGATVGVSESTVVRFATEIGYAGYPELIRSRMTSVQRLEMTEKSCPSDQILSAVLNRDIDIIRRTIEETSHEMFYEAVDAIVSAKKIYIIGVRSSHALASFMAYYFNLLFENVQMVNATSEAEIFEQMIHVDEHDAVIGISFPRYSKRAVKALKFASSRGAKVVAITDSVLSPLADPAEFLLLARSEMASFVDSLVAPLSLINALIVASAIKKKDEVKDVFHSLETIWDEYGVYEKVDEKPGESV